MADARRQAQACRSQAAARWAAERAASDAASSRRGTSRPRHAQGPRRSARASRRGALSRNARGHSRSPLFAGGRRRVSRRRVLDPERSRALHHRGVGSGRALAWDARARDSAGARSESCARHSRAGLGRSISRARAENAQHGSHWDRLRADERSQARAPTRFRRRPVLIGALVFGICRPRREVGRARSYRELRDLARVRRLAASRLDRTGRAPTRPDLNESNRRSANFPVRSWKFGSEFLPRRILEFPGFR